MEKLKYYTVVLDGIDKCGKDTIANYIWRLDKRLNVIVRGFPSLVVYAQKFGRDCAYSEPYKNALYVHLKVSSIDWSIRCDITKEPEIDYISDSRLFDSVFDTLTNEGYNVLTFNTSISTPYKIAKLIVEKIHELNTEEDS